MLHFAVAAWYTVLCTVCSCYHVLRRSKHVGEPPTLHNVRSTREKNRRKKVLFRVYGWGCGPGWKLNKTLLFAKPKCCPGQQDRGPKVKVCSLLVGREGFFIEMKSFVVLKPENFQLAVGSRGRSSHYMLGTSPIPSIEQASLCVYWWGTKMRSTGYSGRIYNYLITVRGNQSSQLRSVPKLLWKCYQNL